MNRAEELKQCFKTKAHSSPDELLARYSSEHPELKEALHLANIAEIRVSYYFLRRWILYFMWLMREVTKKGNQSAEFFRELIGVQPYLADHKLWLVLSNFQLIVASNPGLQCALWIGLENSRLSLNQSDTKLKPIMTWSPPCFPALQAVIFFSSDWRLWFDTRSKSILFVLKLNYKPLNSKSTLKQISVGCLRTATKRNY